MKQIARKTDLFGIWSESGFLEFSRSVDTGTVGKAVIPASDKEFSIY
jgi:hypothetical protein